MIHEIKFRKRKHVAQGLGQLWAKMMTEAPSSDSTPIPPDAILVTLPMHPKKRRERGFDQAAIMAKALAAATGNKLSNILERTKDTPPQSGLHPSQRIENVSGAFRINPKTANLAGQKFIIVDDIYTTGASLNECARVLKSAGAQEIYAMTLAIAIKKPEK